MKILTAAEMREVDARTIQAGIPGLILMENAAHGVVEFLRETFSPLSQVHVVIFCGKGNNGGDGFAIARHLYSRNLAASVTVFETFPADELKGDAATNRKMLHAYGCPIRSINRSKPAFRCEKTVIVDAVLGTGLTGPARGPALDAIDAINNDYPSAVKVAVDMPSGLPSDETAAEGEFVAADYTVTFTALKRSQALSGIYDRMGKVVVRPVGSPAEFCETNPNLKLRLTTPDELAPLASFRKTDSNKGMYGHVYVLGGSFGKSGAPAMAGLGSFRSGAGLVTVGVPKSALVPVASTRPELMTEPLDETPAGRLSSAQAPRILRALDKMTVLAIGPGLGTDDETVQLVRRLYAQVQIPAVVDADALNALAGQLPPAPGPLRVLTPHPGEMARLLGISTKDVQGNRLAIAQESAARHGAVIVLKGDRTVIAFPDGDTWVNSTGSPSMATGGTGDILTGMVAGFLAQYPQNPKLAVPGAVWLHGRCGELAASRLGEQSVLALDLLDHLPAALAELRQPPC